MGEKPGKSCPIAAFGDCLDEIGKRLAVEGKGGFDSLRQRVDPGMRKGSGAKRHGWGGNTGHASLS